jgi:hypothetical protein
MRLIKLLVGVVIAIVGAWGVPARAQSALGVAFESHPAREAGYLVSLFEFATWPGVAGAPDRATLCFFGRSFVVDMIAAAVSRHQRWVDIRGRQLVLTQLDGIAVPADCQILFLSGRAAQEIWNQVSIPPGVLTVSDQPGFVHRGGMIEFRWAAQDSLEMVIHRGRVLESGVTISGELADLARRIDDQRQRNRR